MANHFKLQRAALAASTFLALASVQINGIAQAADSATLNISGQITSTTCNVVISDPGGVGSTATKVLQLGNVSPPAASSAGSTFGTAVAAIFTVSSTAGNTTPCTFQGGATKWDLALSLTSAQISSIGTGTFLRNSLSAASGGTDAVVQLKGGVGTTAAAATTTLNLLGDLGVAGTLMSGQASPVAASTSGIAITAQFARSGTAVPTGGAFSATIPLIARYN